MSCSTPSAPPLGPRRRAGTSGLLPLAVLSVILGGCASGVSGVAALPDREYRGHLITEARANWFRPCTTDAADPRLWVTFTEASVPQIAAARAEGVALPGDTAFVRWRAALTDERHVGPGGPALLVREIAVVRPAGEEDCRP